MSSPALLGILVVVATATARAEPPSPSAPDQAGADWAGRESALGWSVLGAVLDRNEPAGRANVVYSPWCVFRGLMLLADGATGRTAERFASVLPASGDAGEALRLWRRLDPARPCAPELLGLRLTERVEGEVTVSAIRQGSPATAAEVDLRLGDRLLRVNGQLAASEEDVYRGLARPTADVDLMVERPGSADPRTVRLRWPDPTAPGVGPRGLPGGDADPVVLWGASLWLDRASEFVPAFLERGRTTHGAVLERVDFRNRPSEAAAALDRWVALQTRGQIASAVPAGGITPQTRLVSVNTILFHGRWETPFTSTAPGPFHSRGATRDVLKMFTTAPMAVYRDASFEAVEVPYRRGALAMVVLLPRAGRPLRALARDLSARPKALDPPAATRETVELRLPRFVVRSDLELSDALKACGLARAFSLEAEFARLSSGPDRVRLDSAWNQARVAVDEDGTRAVAASALAAVALSTPPEPQRVFDVDRPFLFAIRDQATGMVLFAGAVESIEAR